MYKSPNNLLKLFYIFKYIIVSIIHIQFRYYVCKSPKNGVLDTRVCCVAYNSANND